MKKRYVYLLLLLGLSLTVLWMATACKESTGTPAETTVSVTEAETPITADTTDIADTDVPVTQPAPDTTASSDTAEPDTEPVEDQWSPKV